MKKPTLLFDINETVLDFSALKPVFLDVFGSELALSLWFSQLLHSSTVCSTTNTQTNFRELASVALDQLAARLQMNCSAADKDRVLGQLANLVPHSDVLPAITRLKEVGFSVVAFSNSSKQLIQLQLANSNLIDVFDDVISVEYAACFKPDARAYQYAVEALNEEPNTLWLIAAHDWDTHGALSVGLQAAFVNRFAIPYHEKYISPMLQAHCLNGIAEQLIEKYK